MAKDLLEYADEESAPAKGPVSDDSPDAILLMAKRVGVEDPGALVKLIRACMAQGG